MSSRLDFQWDAIVGREPHKAYGGGGLNDGYGVQVSCSCLTELWGEELMAMSLLSRQSRTEAVNHTPSTSRVTICWYHLPRKPTATKRCEESHDTRHLLGRATHLHTVTLQCRLTQGLIPLLCTHGAECTWIRPCISGRSTYCPIFKLEVLRDFVFTFQVYQHQNCVLSQIRHTCLQKNELSSLSGRKCKGVKRYYLPNLLKRVIWINWKLTRND